MPRVTDRLRRTWADQREQMGEEREFTQSGRPRSPDDVVLVDVDIAVMDRLLSLPVGTTFDAQQIHREVAATFAVGGSSVDTVPDDPAPADPTGPSGYPGAPRDALLGWTEGDAALLRAECEGYGLPVNAGLAGLLRHVYANRDLAHQVNMMTIDAYRERTAALVAERDALRAGIEALAESLRWDPDGVHAAGSALRNAADRVAAIAADVPRIPVPGQD